MTCCIAADESEVFAGYLPYRTWDPRPVAGSAGLYPDELGPRRMSNGARSNCRTVSWQTFRRQMNARDNNAWLAMRMIGEAATRTNSDEPEKLRAYHGRARSSPSRPSRACG